MNFKQKLGYMFIGCLFTIAGYILASLGGDTTHAQQKEQVIDKIVCRKLQVVNKDGLILAEISEMPLNGGGWVRISNKEGKLGAGMHTDLWGGSLNAYDKNGRRQASLSASFWGGRLETEAVVIDESGMEVYNKARQKVASIVVSEHGGVMAVRDKTGMPVVGINSNEHGGVIQVLNTAGKPAAVIGATIDGGGMDTYNTAGKRVVKIGAIENGNGGIQTYKGGWRTH